MTINFTKPERHHDLRSIVRETVLSLLTGTEAFLAATTVSPVASAARYIPRAYGHYEKIRSALGGVESTEPSNLAWKWLSMSLSGATVQFLTLLRRETILVASARDEAVTTFLTKAMDVSPQAEFSAATVLHTGSHPVFEPARSALQALIQDVTRLTKFDLPFWQREFDRCIRASSSHVLSTNHDYFAPLVASLSGVETEAYRRDAAWARHAEWVQNEFQKKPVFSPDGSVTTPLSELYLRLRCYWHEKTENSERGEDEEGGTRWIAHLGDLHGTVWAWLKSQERDLIRVIAGGPGSGKSSFSRAFTCEVNDEGSFRVLFVELQRLPWTGDLYEDLGHVDKWRSQRRIDVMSMKPRKLSAVLS